MRLVLAVDGAYQFHAGWDDELRQTVRTVSGILERQAGIRIETVRIATWHPPQLGDGRALNHLVASIPTGDADVVIGVSGGCDHTHTGSAWLFSRAALALDPNDTRARSNLVDALIRSSRSDDVVSEAQGLVARAPTSALAWQRLVSALMSGRRYADAWAEVQRARRRRRRAGRATG